VNENAFDAAITEAAAWPLNVVCVVVDHAKRIVEIRSGAWGSAPLYAVASEAALWADWDAARLYPHLSRGLDLPRAIYVMVEIGYPYSSQTIFQELMLLTERSVAKWEPYGRLQMQYPLPVPRLKPRKLREGADVVAAFAGLMDETVGIWIDAGRHLATGLSGGIDSSAVAIALATHGGGPVRSYGLIMPGTNGAFQAERRNELIARFGLVDYACAAERYLPFAPHSRRNHDGSFIPWSEFYYDAMGALCRKAREDGVDVFFTGLGGDEISTLMNHEEPDRDIDDADAPRALPPFLTPKGTEAYHEARRSRTQAPRPVTEYSCIEAAATNADLFLRNGLWPAYPYCAPELVNFCRSLPASWRRDRDLQRDYLARRGCSDRVARPQVTENFLDVMTMALQLNQPLLTSLFRESRLADAGLIDRENLQRLYQRFGATGEHEWKDAFLELAVLELTIRAIEQAKPAAH
jgi:asparagine synthase (glutamine-hydrolysing)